ncbi:pleiotropic regulator 1 [Mytilus galloprovincialis]|nr:pleiotropic regulator 1 [Mytilus galloprovincialis]
MQTDPSYNASVEMALYEQNRQIEAQLGSSVQDIRGSDQSKALVTIGQQQALVPKKAQTMAKPVWHPPWKLYRVISGHLGWVRCVAVEPGNQWFATGANDRMIKIWDLASGTLKLSLTGHISAVRGVVVSPRQPYLFSCGEDKQVKCWDLEYNKTIKHYHGHLSAVYAIDLHPTIDVLVTCGRDGTARVWDMRTKACIHTLTGHNNTVADIRCQAAEPQVITGSHDSTIRLWDLAAGKSRVTLTNHKKSVRALTLHPKQQTTTYYTAQRVNEKYVKYVNNAGINNFTSYSHNSNLKYKSFITDDAWSVLIVLIYINPKFSWLFANNRNFRSDKLSLTNYKPGSITLYGMNLKTEPTTVTFPQFKPDIKLYLYMLEPVGKEGLKSQTVALNGKTLKVSPDLTMSQVTDIPEIVNGTFTFPQQSYGFIVISDANVAASKVVQKKSTSEPSRAMVVPKKSTSEHSRAKVVQKLSKSEPSRAMVVQKLSTSEPIRPMAVPKKSTSVPGREKKCTEVISISYHSRAMAEPKKSTSMSSRAKVAQKQSAYQFAGEQWWYRSNQHQCPAEQRMHRSNQHISS